MTKKTKTIKIDNKEYELDSLSDVVKQNLVNLRLVDQEISRLKTQLGIAQVARNVFVSGVVKNLPKEEKQD